MKTSPPPLPPTTETSMIIMMMTAMMSIMIQSKSVNHPTVTLRNVDFRKIGKKFL